MASAASAPSPPMLVQREREELARHVSSHWDIACATARAESFKRRQQRQPMRRLASRLVDGLVESLVCCGGMVVDDDAMAQESPQTFTTNTSMITTAPKTSDTDEASPTEPELELLPLS